MADLALFTILLLPPGLPLALLVAAMPRERVIGTAALAYDALVLGLVVHLLAGVALMRVGEFTVEGILAAAAVVTGGAGTLAFAVRDRLPIVRPPRLDVTSVGCVVVLGIALILRSDPVQFVFMTGDMGEYVNTAFRVATGEPLRESFPHLFAVFLAFPALLSGYGHVGTLPLTGLLLIGGILRLAGVLWIGTVPRLLVAGGIAAGVVPTWFSLFPVTESLYAPLLVALITFLARAHREECPSIGVVAGIFVLLLGLLRGNALLLAAVIPMALLISAVVSRRIGTDLAFGASALTGLAASFAYNARYVRGYFTTQIGEFTSEGVAELVVGMARNPVFVTMGVLLATASAAALWGLRRGTPHLGRERLQALGRTFPGVVLAATMVSLVGIGTEGVVGSLVRMGPLVPLAGILGLTFGLRPGTGGASARMILLCTLLVGAYTILRALHRSDDLRHAYFLYWDRFLYSEVFPALTVGALIGLGLVWSRFSAATTGAIRTSVGVLVILAPLLSLEETLRATRHRLLGDAATFVGEVSALARPRDVPFVYSGLPERVPGLWFPNTFRFVATPLTYRGHRFLNDPGPNRPFSPDPVPSLSEARRLMRRHGIRRVFLIRAVDESTSRQPPPEDTEVRFIGQITQSIPMLHHLPDREVNWWIVELTVEVLDVRRSGAGSSRQDSSPEGDSPGPPDRSRGNPAVDVTPSASSKSASTP